VTSGLGGGWKPIAISALTVAALLAIRPLLAARGESGEATD
jgi:hypothetical protein